MNGTKPIVCPKCRYKRGEADQGLSEHECPKCGVVYEKALEKINELKRLDNIAAYEKMIESKRNRSFLYALGCVLALLGTLFFYLSKDQEIPSGAATWMDMESVSLFVRPEEPFPVTKYSVYTSEACPARFTIISTDELNRIILLYDQASGNIIYRAYLNAGETIDSMVPIGKYIYRVIAGHKWLDGERHFGLKTMYHEGINALNFGDENGVQNVTITLSVTDGNFPVKPVGRAVVGF
jgi:Zn-finger nucleic acid-binding protein